MWTNVAMCSAPQWHTDAKAVEDLKAQCAIEVKTADLGVDLVTLTLNVSLINRL